MNKSDLVQIIADSGGVKEKNAKELLDKLLEAMIESLKKGEEVALTGFGTFCTRERKARRGRNPQTGAALEIPASKVAAFKVGKLLKEAVQKE